MNTKRLVVAGYIDGPWQHIEVDPAFGEVELWDHDMADFVSIDPFDAPSDCSYFAHLYPCDGELQRTIDEAEMTAEYEDDMLDREFWAGGQW